MTVLYAAWIASCERLVYARVRHRPRELTIAIEDVVARIDEWRGRAVTVRPITTGLTNTNYRVDVGGQAFLVRLPGAATELLGIDREIERRNTATAAATGIGPRVVHLLPESGAMVIEFIHGRTPTNQDLQAPGMPERVARSLRILHGGPRFANDFDMLGLADYYLEVTEGRGIPIPATYRDRLPLIGRIRAALAARAPASVPCHNDLLADNYIDDGRLLRFVDYEYSGNGDPDFELGNTCLELEYDDARIAAITGAYHGAATAHRVARVKLNMIVSDVGWTLWAAIQATISRLEFDFVTYGRRRWERAEAMLAGQDLAGWLAAARRPDRAGHA